MTDTATATATPGQAPPSVMQTGLPVLHHIVFSHYNEKVRWALDYKRVPHRRKPVIPGLHPHQMKRLSGARTTPVLELDGGTVSDSTQIIAEIEKRWPDPPLYPAGEAERRRALELEDFFDENLGAEIRRAFFFYLLPHMDRAFALLSIQQNALTRLAMRVGMPFVKPGLKRSMGIDEEGAKDGLAKTVASIERIEAELQPSGYLAGEAFSVADLTAAALLGPALMAPEFPVTLPEPPPVLAEFRASIENRDGFRWALDMYRRHRGVSAEVGA